MENLIYASGEIYWMTGVLAVGVIFALFALVWGKNEG